MPQSLKDFSLHLYALDDKLITAHNTLYAARYFSQTVIMMFVIMMTALGIHIERRRK